MDTQIPEVPNDRKNNALFKAYWRKFATDVMLRVNIKESHYQQLKLLCDEMVEYEILKKIIENVGYTYEVQGRYIERPEVRLKNKNMENIVKYSKLLNIQPFKDTSTADGSAIVNGVVINSKEEEF